MSPTRTRSASFQHAYRHLHDDLDRYRHRHRSARCLGRWLAPGMGTRLTVAPACRIAALGILLGSLACGGCNRKAPGPPLSGDRIRLEVGGHELIVEVVTDPLGRQNGLMFRRELPDSSGMLFVYPRPEKLSFWMRNTYVPLSIAFLDQKGKILQIEDMQPKDESRTVSKYRVRYALEVNQGWFRRNGVGVEHVFRDFENKVRLFRAR